MAKKSWKKFPRVRYRQRNPQTGKIEVLFDELLPPGTTKAEAKRHKEELLRRYKLGAKYTSGGTLYEFIPRFFAILATTSARQYSTILKQARDIKAHIIPDFGHMALGDIRASDLIDWQLRKSSELSANTYKNVRSHFNAILKAAVADERIQGNPWSGIKGITVQKAKFNYWTAAESNRFLCYAKERDFQVFQVIAFAIHTGLRPGEMRALLRKDIDFRAGSVWVNRTWCTKTNSLKNRTKTGEPRRVPIPRQVLAAIGNLEKLPPEEQLFPFLVNAWGFNRFQPLAKEAGLIPIKFHECRHSFASQCIMAGMSMVEVKELLGHSKITTTIDTYTHISDQVKKASTDRLLEGATWDKTPSSVAYMWPTRLSTGTEKEIGPGT